MKKKLIFNLYNKKIFKELVTTYQEAFVTIKPLLDLSLGEIILVKAIFDQNQMSLIKLNYYKISFVKKLSHSTKRLVEVKTVY